MSSSFDPATAFEIRRILPAPRERVFEAWAKKEQLEQWMCKDVPTHWAEYVELDVRPGGHYVIEIKLPEGGMYRGRGAFREVIPPEKLVFTWSWEKIDEKTEEGDKARPTRHESLVTVQLFDRGSSTEISLTHYARDAVFFTAGGRFDSTF